MEEQGQLRKRFVWWFDRRSGEMGVEIWEVEDATLCYNLGSEWRVGKDSFLNTLCLLLMKIEVVRRSMSKTFMALILRHLRRAVRNALD